MIIVYIETLSFGKPRAKALRGPSVPLLLRTMVLSVVKSDKNTKGKPRSALLQGRLLWLKFRQFFCLNIHALGAIFGSFCVSGALILSLSLPLRISEGRD